MLLPIGVVYLWRRRGRRAGLVVLGSFLATAAACFLPFAVLAPDGLRAMFADQLNRPLQVESLGSAVLMAAERFGMRPLHTINSHGAQALSGRGAGLAADLSTVLESCDRRRDLASSSPAAATRTARPCCSRPGRR